MANMMNSINNNFQPNMNNLNQGMYQMPAMGNVWNRIQQQQNYALPHYEAPLLHGEQDANNFIMGPNSEILLPDADEDIVWWIKTDQTGTKTVMPFDVSPHKKPEPINLNTLVARLEAIEERLNNGKSNKSNASRRSNANSNATTATDASTITE